MRYSLTLQMCIQLFSTLNCIKRAKCQTSVCVCVCVCVEIIKREHIKREKDRKSWEWLMWVIDWECKKRTARDRLHICGLTLLGSAPVSAQPKRYTRMLERVSNTERRWNTLPNDAVLFSSNWFGNLVQERGKTCGFTYH